MCDHQFDEIRLEYISGVSYAALSEKYGISISKLKKIGQKEGWFKQKKQVKFIQTNTIENHKKNAPSSLDEAVTAIAEIISMMAVSMKKNVKAGEDSDVKQLKELTCAAKELAVLIKNLEDKAEAAEDDATKEASVQVSFDEAAEKWAQ